MTDAISPALRWSAGALAAIAALTGAAAQFGGGGGYREQSGKDIYEHVCQGCHMPDAKGASGAGRYPALADDARLAARLYPVVVILKGRKAMPPFADLTDAQVAAVTNYIRTHFGNAFPDTVTPAEVEPLRPPGAASTSLRPG